MCGIAGIYLKNPDKTYVSDIEIEMLVDSLLVGIEPRGDHATGISLMDRHGITCIEKSDMPASKFVAWRRDVTPAMPRTILLHTRWATKGSPMNLLNNHPIEYKNVTVIHNGHISNDDSLFKDEALPRIAEVDSEIIAALINKHGFEDIQTALEKLDGNFAIAAHDTRSPGKLLLAKGYSSPLVFIETTGAILWASTEKCLKDAMKVALGYEVKYTEIEDLGIGEYLMIENDEVKKGEFKPYVRPYQPTKWTNSQTVGRRTPVRYTDGWGSYQGWEIDQCDACYEKYSRSQLVKIGVYLYCYDCEEDYKEKEKKDEKRAKRWAKRNKKKRRKQQNKRQNSVKVTVIENDEVTEKLNDEHWLVCELVAEAYSTKPEFVDHVLFSDDEVLPMDDPNFVTIYTEFEGMYTDLMKELTEDECENPFVAIRNPVGF